MSTNYQNMFNRDFYPTPEKVIEEMLKVSEVTNKIILEPSAGTGNIVDTCGFLSNLSLAKGSSLGTSNSLTFAFTE